MFILDIFDKQMTKINGNSYDWDSLLVTIQGVPVIGITEINYEDSVDMDFTYGTGLYPVDRKYGKYIATGSITLEVGEATLLEKASVDGLVQNLPQFNMQIIHMPKNQIPRVTVLNNCKIISNSRGLSQGDMNPQVTFELHISHISRY